MDEINTFLIKENHREESARDQNYQMAIEASRSHVNVSLQECGVRSFNSDGFYAPLTLKSIPNVTPTSPLLIPSNRRMDECSAPTALGSPHPFSSMASFSSNLEISHSPTAECFSISAQCNHNHPEPSKLCQDIRSSLVQHSEGEGDLGVQDTNEEDEVEEPSMYMHNQPKSQEPNVSCNYPSITPGSEISMSPQNRDCFPIECTDTTSTSRHIMPTNESEKDKVQRTDKALVGVSSSTDTIESSPSSTVPLQDDTTALQHSANSKAIISATSPLTETDDSERTFFSFVILHAKGDETIALNVRDTLQNFGIPDGTTYCEEFETPGHSPLTCIEDAVHNSAFTILLLTSRFVSRWALLQTNAVLMNSINKEHKYNSIIPFLPKEDPLKEIPMVLNSIVPLNEKLPSFSRTARKTFKLERIKKMKAIWEQEEKVMELNRSCKVIEQQVKYNQHINSASVEMWRLQQTMACMYSAPPFHFPGPQQLFPPGIQLVQPPPATGDVSPPDFSQTLPSMGPLFPQMAQMPFPLSGMPFPTGYMQHYSDAQGTQYAASGGTQPVIQIQHAKNVQIGDHNQMRLVETIERNDSLNGMDSESDCIP